MHESQSYWTAQAILGELELLTPHLQQAWVAIGKMAQAGQHIDIVTLRQYLPDHTLAVLAGLAADVPTPEAVKSYAELVKEWAIRRKLQSVFHRGLERTAQVGSLQAVDIATEAQKSILESVQASVGKQLKDASEIAHEVVFGDQPLVRSTPTRWAAVDQLLDDGGIADGSAVIVAGRPGMGKTAFAVQLAFRLALGKGQPALFMTYEMSPEYLTIRLLSGLANVPQHRIKKRRYRPEDHERIRAGAVELEKGRVLFLQANGVGAAGVGAWARTVSAVRGGISCVAVDYLQLMPEPPGRSDKRADAVADNMHSLTHLGKELGVPVIVLSQFNRELEKRPDKRPTMADLKESGAIEEDADVIFGMYREGYYSQPPSNAGPAEIMLLKQRNGDRGTATLHFSGETASFQDLRSEQSTPSSPPGRRSPGRL